MLSMVLAAALAATPAAAMTEDSDSPPSVAIAASAPPPGAAPGARIFSYADLKAMDAKVGGSAPSLERARSSLGEARDTTIHPRQRKRSLVHHAAATSVQLPAVHPVAPNLRPAFAMKDGAKFTR